MTFKDIVASDNAAVFMNVTEHAELHDVKYDGDVFHSIPVVLADATELEGNANLDGIFRVSAQAFINVNDLGGIVPERGKRICISDGTALGRVFYKTWTVVNVSCEMGMVQMELGAYDE